jgi:hypothetical protein
MTFATLTTTLNTSDGLINYNITQLVSDAPTTVQLLTCTKSTTEPFLSAPTTQLNTLELLANKPVRIFIETNTTGAAQNYEGAGVLIRNMVSGTRVTVMYSRLELRRYRT